MTDPIEVSQAAREAAVNAWVSWRGKSHVEDEIMAIHEGRNDEHPLVQAFARFEQATRDDALEMAAGVADNLGGNRADASRPDHDRGRGDAVIRAMQVRAKTVAIAIRALKGGGA